MQLDYLPERIHDTNKLRNIISKFPYVLRDPKRWLHFRHDARLVFLIKGQYVQAILWTLGLTMRFCTPQAVSSSTFRPPPPDGSLTLVEILDYNASHNPDHTMFLYEQSDGNIRNIPWAEAGLAFHRAASMIRKHVGLSGTEEPVSRPTVAILASAGRSLLKVYAEAKC